MLHMSEEEYEISQTIRIPKPVPQEGILVSRGDWDSFIARIESCRMAHNTWAMAYSVSFAIGVTSGLTVIPVAFSELPLWVLIFYIVLCAVGLAAGIILAIAERALARRQRSQVDNLVEDMLRTRTRFVQATPTEDEEVTLS